MRPYIMLSNIENMKTKYRDFFKKLVRKGPGRGVGLGERKAYLANRLILKLKVHTLVISKD